MMTIQTMNLKHVVLKLLICFFLINAFNSDLAAAEAEIKKGPTLETIKQEFNHQLPSMWRLKDLTISDVIYTQGANPPIWKAKIMASIESTDDTYLPTEYGLGTITVVRLIHKAGKVRKLFARAAARIAGKNGWEVAFQFDNDVTLSAGLPLSYYFGEVVIEGSDEYKALGNERLSSHIDATIKEHLAALHSLEKTHAAEVEVLKKELNTLDDVEALESAISGRIYKLLLIVKKLHHRLEETMTQLHTQGIVIKQWVSSVVGPCKDLPDDNETKYKKKCWNITRPSRLLGVTNNSSWNPQRGNNQFTGIVPVRVEFTEAVVPTELTIFEMGNHGFVRRLTFHGVDTFDNKTITVQDATKECPGTLTIQIVGVDFPTRSVTIEIDTDHTNEGERFSDEGIDAVQLTGVIRQETKQ